LRFSNYLILISLIILISGGTLLFFSLTFILDSNRIFLFSNRTAGLSTDLFRVIHEKTLTKEIGKNILFSITNELSSFEEKSGLILNSLYDNSGELFTETEKLYKVIDSYGSKIFSEKSIDYELEYISFRQAFDKVFLSFSSVVHKVLKAINFFIFSTLISMFFIFVFFIILVFLPIFRDLQTLSKGRFSAVKISELRFLKIKNKKKEKK